MVFTRFLGCTDSLTHSLTHRLTRGQTDPIPQCLRHHFSMVADA